MDFAWISDLSRTRKSNPYLSKLTASAGSSPPVIIRTSEETSVARLRQASTTGSVRRPRADTMPTAVPYPTTSSLGLPSSLNRHRSGSATFVSEAGNGFGATLFHSALGPPSPSTVDDPSSPVDDETGAVASTLASLGLDDHPRYYGQTASCGTLSGSSTEDNIRVNALPNRSRAYTVGTRAPMRERPDVNRLLMSMRFDPFSNESEERQQLQQRPRAISLGTVDDPSLSSIELSRLQQQQYTMPQLFPPPPPPSHALDNFISGHQPDRMLRGTRSSNNLLDLLNCDGIIPAFDYREPVVRQEHLHASKELYAPAASLDAQVPAYTTTGTDNNERLSSAPSSSSLSGVAQTPSRALWLGNIDPSLSVPDLMQRFSCYGHVESARILSDKECAFINFATVEAAIAAKTDLETRLGSKLQGTIVRVGYGKADVNQAMASTLEAGPNAQGPTRALWIGNIPANMNPAMLRTIFQPFGPIESVRVLSHKNCGFVNFELQQDAVRARKALQNKEILGPGTGAVRIGFAKAPSASATTDDCDNNNDNGNMLSGCSTCDAAAVTASPDTYQATQWAAAMMMSSMMKSAAGQTSSSQPTSLYAAIATERLFIAQQLGLEVPQLENEEDHIPKAYCSTIPIIPELGSDRKLEPLRLREIRKRLDNGQAVQEVESMALECMDEIVGLCNDYIGNTVVQRLFEHCSGATKLMMLECIAPYLAAIAVHKNGTWAAQKIIDHSNTAPLIQLISVHIAPYVPLLLLDQFGNYVVQCCLRKGPGSNQFIIDAIADKCWEIGQGRFGARAVRAILESSDISKEQQITVAAAIIQNAILLTTNSNGVLLLIWLLDTSNLPGRFGALCPRLLPHLARLCTHKLGSMTVFKVINQQHEPDARQLLLNAIFNEPAVLDGVLRDQVHGVGFVQKVLTIPQLERRDIIARKVKESLTERLHVHNVQAYKRLFDELNQLDSGEQTEQEEQQSDPFDIKRAIQGDMKWTQNPKAVAIMANMYAAAMTTAATSVQQQTPSSSSSSAAATQDLPLDGLIKSIFQDANSQINKLQQGQKSAESNEQPPAAAASSQ